MIVHVHSLFDDTAIVSTGEELPRIQKVAQVDQLFGQACCSWLCEARAGRYVLALVGGAFL